MFLLHIKRNIFFIQCLYGYVIITLKLLCKDRKLLAGVHYAKKLHVRVKRVKVFFALNLSG